MTIIAIFDADGDHGAIGPFESIEEAEFFLASLGCNRKKMAGKAWEHKDIGVIMALPLDLIAPRSLELKHC